MNQPITFRTLIITNGLTVLLFVAFLLVSGTAAHPLLQANTASTQTTTISYQGHLTDNAGEPVNGDLPMTFALYDAPTGGTAVWTEERSGSNTVPVTAGLFNVLLGSVSPIDVNLFQQQGLWLGISVNGDTEMTPREPLSDVAYASVAGTVPDGSISSNKLGLQYDQQCISSSTTIDSNGEVPGMSLEFSLDRPSLVLIAMEGAVSFKPTATNTSRYEMGLFLNGEREALRAFWSGNWNGVDAHRIVQLDAGNHRLYADAHMDTGHITLYGPEFSYPRNHFCINYTVLGEQ